MRLALVVILLLLFCPDAWAFDARVVKIYDGDTVSVRDSNGKPYRVRLWGIDAPEGGQPGGREATEHCAAIALGQLVDVESKGYDKYARMLAVLTFIEGERAGQTLNREMIRAGHAWAYGATRWKNDQALAKKEGRGLWRQKAPLPPKKWRKG